LINKELYADDIIRLYEDAYVEDIYTLIFGEIPDLTEKTDEELNTWLDAEWKAVLKDKTSPAFISSHECIIAIDKIIGFISNTEFSSKNIDIIVLKLWATLGINALAYITRMFEDKYSIEYIMNRMNPSAVIQREYKNITVDDLFNIATVAEALVEFPETHEVAVTTLGEWLDQIFTGISDNNFTVEGDNNKLICRCIDIMEEIPSFVTTERIESIVSIIQTVKDIDIMRILSILSNICNEGQRGLIYEQLLHSTPDNFKRIIDTMDGDIQEIVTEGIGCLSEWFEKTYNTDGLDANTILMAILAISGILEIFLYAYNPTR
jgi:hypothetical protein